MFKFLLLSFYIFVSSLIFCHSSFAKNNENFSTDKLWQKFSKSQIETIKKINESLQQKNFDTALKYANSLHNKDKSNSLSSAIVDIVLWNKYSGDIGNKNIAFSDISGFVLDNPYLPNINQLKRNVERVAIVNNVPYDISKYYFAINPPGSADSKIFAIESEIDAIIRSQIDEKQKIEQRNNIQGQIAKVWIKENFSVAEEEKFLAKYKMVLNESDHIERIERLLWDGNTNDAMRIFNFINSEHKNLFESIIKITESPKYIDNIIVNIPRKLRNNELLSYRRILWLKAQNNIDELLDILINLPNTQRPEKWWNIRRLYGREMLKKKQYQKAYDIISTHNLPTSSSDFWEAQWTTGWIALRFLQQPKLALNHFQLLRKNVTMPVTVSRALYWLGMTHEAMQDNEAAIKFYKEGTNYPTFFYGQLAIHKHRNLDPLGAEKDIILPKNPEINERDMLKISESRAAQIGYILAMSGDKTNASKIFEWLINNSPTDGQIAVVMKIINEIGDKEIDAKISRVAARKNVFFIKEKFQIVKEVYQDEYAPLVHAIIKQESGFAQMAVSRVGALGYMQLMPATAKLVAKELGIKYDQAKLTRDIQYNIRLGSFYIKKLIDQFSGSEMLAIASYNAGPNATKRWIDEFYDPRLEKDHNKIIDWIELITYSETRNYVQRIIENMIVYKYLMSRNNYDQLQ
jgi:soluble lytic murein transglycosylase